MPVTITSSESIIFSSVHDGLPHSVEIFGSFAFSLFEVEVADDFFPSGFLVELLLFLFALLFFGEVVGCSFCFLLFFRVHEVFQLFASLFLALPLQFPFSLLCYTRLTLFSFSIFCTLYYYYLILRVTSSSSKSLKSFSLSPAVKPP